VGAKKPGCIKWLDAPETWHNTEKCKAETAGFPKTVSSSIKVKPRLKGL